MLHRFEWITDNRIGDLPTEWNHLAMEYPARNDASLYHFTVGTPCFAQYANCDNSDYWWRHYARVIAPVVDLGKTML